MRYVYRLDAMDTISSVSPAWLRFARENDASELNEGRVLGRVIWDFVQGVEVRRLYATLFSSLRTRGEPIVVPFRCDSPELIRSMELMLRALPARGIELEGRLLDQKTREPVVLFSRRTARSDAMIPICSLCRRVFFRAAWLEAEQAIASGRMFDGPPLPRLAESVCEECSSAATEGA